MATTKELIEALQKADPSGNQEVVVQHENYAYNISSNVLLANVDNGEIDEESDEPNCLLMQTIF